MLWSKLSEYFDHEIDGGTLDEDGFISYTIKDGYSIQVKASYNDMWYTATYLQIILDEETNNEIFVIQLEGLPEDPTNILIETYANDTIIPSKIYKQIIVDI